MRHLSPSEGNREVFGVQEAVCPDNACSPMPTGTPAIATNAEAGCELRSRSDLLRLWPQITDFAGRCAPGMLLDDVEPVHPTCVIANRDA
jgi:hypothetical protein